ncbi:MAG: TetR/AcrR family transcriptional regulator [Desulfosudaceae bacterium]
MTSTAEADLSPSRREKIYQAARSLFFQYGYRGTSMAMIAEKAGYSKKAIYLDYRNKDDLFLHLVAEGTAILLEQLLQIPHAELAVDEAIAAFFRVYYDFADQYEEYFKMAFAEATPAVAANTPIALQQRLVDLSRACLDEAVKVARRAIEAGIVMPMDPHEAAGVFLAAATGNIMLAKGAGRILFTSETLDQISEKSIRIILRGILTRPDEAANLLSSSSSTAVSRRR